MSSPQAFFIPQPLVQPGSEIPARVRAAMEMFSRISNVYNATVIPLSAGGAHESDARSLTVEEHQVYGAVADFLAGYFKGTISEDKEPKRHIELVVRCPQCGGGHRSDDCGLCKGTGAVACRPITREGTDD